VYLGTAGSLLGLGGLWVKIGQYIASRSDLVAPPIVRHLSRMLDANPPRPLSQTMRTLVRELGERASAIESFDPTPLSTASIAQACTAHRRGCA
jgi:predicted unusual protein kinase regulating ubiquinone biosynthesis (AarF/ABC1/UbiB family)